MGEEITCTAYDGEWPDGRPTFVMHPPCACPRCAPDESIEAVEGDWLRLPGAQQRLRVIAAELGDTGHRILG